MPIEVNPVTFKTYHLEGSTGRVGGILCVTLANEEHGLGVERDQDFVQFSVSQIPEVIAWLTKVFEEHKQNGTTA